MKHWAIFLLLCSAAAAQTITGSITGSVADPSGNLIAGARVTLVSERNGEERSGIASEEGVFVFPGLAPGPYTIKVEHPGFRSYTRSGNVLTAAQRLAVGTIELQVGSVNESVNVTAQGAQVETATSDRTALLTSKQLEMVAIRGRDVISMLRLLPGVAQQVDTEFTGGSFGTGTPNIQGTRSNWNSVQVDGLTGNDLGSPNTNASPIVLDAIGEVKVLLNNYLAEYGRNGASSINIVTKSGGREFHGTVYGFKRHEMFNANSFFNNRTGLRKPIYRFNTIGFTLGGPVEIPKVWTKMKDKLFFFYAYEGGGLKNPQAIRQVTMPTALERVGNFSQTFDTNNRLITINDPLAANRAPFTGNMIPVARINRNGQAVLNLFPLPNITDRAITAGQYNYQFQESLDQPRHQNLFRVDYRPTNKDTISARGSAWYADSLGHAVAAGSANWGLTRQHYTYTDNGVVLSWTRVVSPRLVNEFTGGLRHAVEKGPPESDEELAKMQRSARNLSTLGQFYPQNNALGIIPQTSFGGVQNAANITYDGRYPLRGADTVFNFTDNITYIRGAHTFKAGFFSERDRNYEGEQGTYGGLIRFDRDANNPFDSNYAYSNAILGNFANYTESSTRPSNEGRKTVLSWFVQDSWRANRKLTVDIGMRMVWYTQWVQASGKAAAFVLDRFNPAKVSQLYRPVSTPQGRRAVNPLTGEIFPAVYIGGIIPGTGEPFNGAVVASDSSYPAGFKDRQPVAFEPRIGFAYDVFGNGKTAIRSSFGIFHNTVSPGIRSYSQNPPIQLNPIVYYGNLDTFLGSSGVLFPSNINAFDRNAITPALYSYTFGVQHDVGRGTVVDVAYVGNVGRHLQQSRNLNAVPYGARFLPQNADPTNPSTPLNDNFFRPLYSGWGNVSYNENAGTSSYNALQATMNRRFARGITFGIAYTWSKAMNYGDSDGDGIAQYRPIRVWNYGKAGYDQTHVFVGNYTWDLPRASTVLPSPVTRWVLDDWQISGITTFASGFPTGVGFSTVDTIDITGGGDGGRINVTGKAQLPWGERNFERFFNTSVFARPARGDFGNAPRDVFRQPGIANWDISLFKRFPLRNEQRSLTFRWEMYNAFNHTQFNAVDTTARFDAAGNQTNARFGQVTGTRLERRMQLGLRFSF